MTATDKDPPNLGLLIKLLKMTTSSSDAEALSAMRKANEQLAKFGGDWERLLLGKVKIIADPFSSIQAPPAPRQRPAPEPPAPQPTRAPAAPASQFPDWTTKPWDSNPVYQKPQPTATEIKREAEARMREAEMRERVKLQRAKDKQLEKERLRARAARLNLDDLDIQI